MRWVRRNEDKPHRCPECHAVATWGHRRAGPRTRLTCPRGCDVQWRYGRRLSAPNSRTRTGRRSFRTWADELESALRKDPVAWARYQRDRAELFGAWEVVCRHGCCIWWVSQDSTKRENLGGVGPAACPCACNDEDGS